MPTHKVVSENIPLYITCHRHQYTPKYDTCFIKLFRDYYPIFPKIMTVLTVISLTMTRFSTLVKHLSMMYRALWDRRNERATRISQCTRLVPPSALMYPSGPWVDCWKIFHKYCYKANLRDLIAATGLVILLKLDSNRRFFSPCDLEIWWMTPKNNRAPLLCYFKLFASFRSHWWIQTGVTFWKRLIWVKIDDYLSRLTLKFDGWPSKIRGHLFYATSSFV